MFQATLRGWKRLAAGLLLAPGLAGVGAEARGQARFAEDSGHAPPAEAPAATQSDAARQLMKQARVALDRNDFAKAREAAERAKALRLPAKFWDETPEHLLAELDRRSVSRGSSAGAPAPAAAANKARQAPSEPKALVKQGRQALEAGRLEVAQDLARQAEAIKPSSQWGLFDDTPRDLLKDVQKAKSRRERDESVRLLHDARGLFEKKTANDAERAANLERAQSMAFQAERLHGPYSVWDFGDRPGKLVSEIESARSKLKITAAAHRAQPPASEGSSKPAGMNPVRRDQVASRMPTPRPTTTKTADHLAAGGQPGDSTAKAKARALMQQAIACEVRGDLLEAHRKLVEAREMHAAFTADEDSPDTAINHLQANAARRIRVQCQKASELMQKRDPASLGNAEANLSAAEKLAKGLGLDVQVIADHRATLASMRGSTSVATLPKAQPPAPVAPDAGLMLPTLPPPAPMQTAPTVAATRTPVSTQPGVAPAPMSAPTQNLVALPAPAPPALPMTAPQPAPMVVNAQPAAPEPGHEMLAKARLELRKGETDLARRLTIEVISGSYGAKEEAQSLLRTIEAEELNQRRLTAKKSYEAAQAKFNSHEYAQALSILQLIDPGMLNVNQRAALREMMVDASTQVARQAVARAPEGGLVPAAATAPASQAIAAAAPVEAGPSRSGADSLLKQQEALQEIQFQKLRAEGLKVQSEATTKFGKGETDAALEQLQGYLNRVKQSSVDPAKVALLARPVESRMEQLRVLKQQQDFFSKSSRERNQIKKEIGQEALTREHRKDEVGKLMKQYDALMDAHKYAEAQMLAMKAAEIDPDDVTVGAAVQVAKRLHRVTTWERQKAAKEEWNWKVGGEAHEFGPPVTMDQPLSIDPEDWKKHQNRRDYRNGVGTLRNRTPQERDIERKLTSKITIDFKSAPLTDVIEYLRTVTALNITLDTRAMEEKNISAKQLITETLRDIELKSALNIILKKCNLTHVIEDNALKITTESMARGRLQQKVFPVADLVIPIENYATPATSDLNRTLERVIQSNRPTIGGLTAGGGATPFTPPYGLQANTGTQVGSGSAGGRLQNNPTSGSSTIITGPKGTMEEALIKLITNTVKPESWSEVGGPGTIDYYPIGLALVIQQTPDVIEQVADLLEALRRLQDLEVAVEIRLITLAEAFFERIGLDFSLNIQTQNTNFQPQLTNGVFSPAPFINRLNVRGVTTGLTPAGTFTPDLDIPIRSTSFQQSIPPFGGFQNLANNGGLTLGLAFLNEIQVYMFLEASQGDRRTNVMQAPRLTMFNGQSAQIQISDQQFFVTGVSVVSVNGQIVFVPQNTPFSFGVTMSMQPVVSADRRFVRMNINQQMTNLASAVVPLFPITSFVTPVFEGGAQGQPIPFTQFLQQPTIASLNVQTTVIVPDGGTVMIGGLKTLSEGRNEFGPPVLSKIPYVNRLFKNVGYGREAQTMMMMVTPRVIINREEQERQTGVIEENFTNVQ